MTRSHRIDGWTAAGLSLLWTYLWVALLFQGKVSGVVLRTRYAVPMLVASWVLTFAAISWSASRGTLTRERQKEIITLALAVLFSLIAVDVLYAAYQTARSPAQEDPWAYARRGDAHLWHGELFPRSYSPTDANFTVYKPNVRVSGLAYGEFYDTRMLESPTLVESVLQLRPLTYSIDDNGFRNRIPIEQADIFALGDSFVLGYATDEGSTWIDRLGERIGRPIYNLGVSASGPGVQLQLLEYLTRSKPEKVAVKHLLWMIYEGNDLENSYEALRPEPPAPPTGMALVRALTVAPVVSAVRRVKERSVIGKLGRGELRLRRRSTSDTYDPYVVDGVPLTYPLYHSERLGWRLFNPLDIDRATRDAAYVQSHPNRPALDQTFERMKALSERLGFRVTVLIAPSAVRMHAADFAHFPQISAAPHFIEYVDRLARRTGFEVIDLLPLMAPHAREGLLYYRDDHHWSERGNEAAAEVISSHVRF